MPDDVARAGLWVTHHRKQRGLTLTVEVCPRDPSGRTSVLQSQSPGGGGDASSGRVPSREREGTCWVTGLTLSSRPGGDAFSGEHPPSAMLPVTASLSVTFWLISTAVLWAAEHGHLPPHHPLLQSPGGTASSSSTTCASPALWLQGQPCTCPVSKPFFASQGRGLRGPAPSLPPLLANGDLPPATLSFLPWGSPEPSTGMRPRKLCSNLEAVSVFGYQATALGFFLEEPDVVVPFTGGRGNIMVLKEDNFKLAVWGCMGSVLFLTTNVTTHDSCPKSLVLRLPPRWPSSPTAQDRKVL